jgi:hypothetical protein
MYVVNSKQSRRGGKRWVRIWEIPNTYVAKTPASSSLLLLACEKSGITITASISNTRAFSKSAYAVGVPFTTLSLQFFEDRSVDAEPALCEFPSVERTVISLPCGAMVSANAAACNCTNKVSVLYAQPVGGIW